MAQRLSETSILQTIVACLFGLGLTLIAIGLLWLLLDLDVVRH